MTLLAHVKSLMNLNVQKVVEKQNGDKKGNEREREREREGESEDSKKIFKCKLSKVRQVAISNQQA